MSLNFSLESGILFGRSLRVDNRVGPSFSNSERSRGRLRRSSGRSRSPRVVSSGSSSRGGNGLVGGRGSGIVERDGGFGSRSSFDFGKGFDGSGNSFGGDGYGNGGMSGNSRRRRRSRLGRVDGPVQFRYRKMSKMKIAMNRLWKSKRTLRFGPRTSLNQER